MQETIDKFMEKLDDISEAVRDINDVTVIDSETKHNILEMSCSVHKIGEELENLNKAIMLILVALESRIK